MNTIARFILAVLAVLFLAALLSPPAWSAQAILRPGATPTPGTACGQKAIGRNRYTLETWELEEAGQRVDADGNWESCTMPVAPPMPSIKASCVTAEALEWTGADGHVCRHRGAIEIPHMGGRMINADPGQLNGGGVFYSCRNGELRRGSIACSPAVECAGSYRGTDDGGATWWAWSGRLREGSTAQASDGAGNSRPIRCEGGRLRLQ